MIRGKQHRTFCEADTRNGLFAAFVVGLKACESAIEEARYLQAHTLLRQELEILAQLKAVRAGRRKPNSSPNVTALDPSLRRLYGGAERRSACVQ